MKGHVTARSLRLQCIGPSSDLEETSRLNAGLDPNDTYDKREKNSMTVLSSSGSSVKWAEKNTPFENADPNQKSS